MKVITILIFLLGSICSCEKDIIEPFVETNFISFTGDWTRSFEVGGPDGLHIVNYAIYQDSIRYKLEGSVGNANYLLVRDTFLASENRFIGHTEAGKYFLLFAKDITKKKISIYKQEIENITAGMGVEFPSAENKENHGWNDFEKE